MLLDPSASSGALGKFFDMRRSKVWTNSLTGVRGEGGISVPREVVLLDATVGVGDGDEGNLDCPCGDWLLLGTDDCIGGNSRAVRDDDILLDASELR